MTKKIKWGVLGYARIARDNVIPAIIRSSNAEFYAIASNKAESLVECSEKFGNKKSYNDYDALLNDPDIEAVYIPLPNSMHCEWTVKALNHKKHVLCEKPLAITSVEFDKMSDAAEKNKVFLMEAFMYRYSDRMKKANIVINNGTLGEIKYIDSCYRFLLNRPNTIKMKADLGGGSLYDVGCYPLNFISMITGVTPAATASAAVLKDGVDVLFSGVLRFSSGIVANVNCGFNAYNVVFSEVVGTHGVLKIPDTFLGNSGKIILETSDGIEEIQVDESDRYKLEIEDFSSAIIEGRPPFLTLDESKVNIEIIEKLISSIQNEIK
jgi:D-xylose 1-dehydrogenase (NADP+, D-xylono-1,5-lactone-forming)